MRCCHSACSHAGRCLPAVAAEADANADAGGTDADAGARAVIPVAIIAATFDIALARLVIVIGIADDHTAAAAGAIAVSGIVADEANLLYEIRTGVFTAGVDIGRPGAADRQR